MLREFCAAEGWLKTVANRRVSGNATVSALPTNGVEPAAKSPTRVEAGPSSERVYREIRRMILNGALEPNARLVELQLASQFGVSRTPVREALKRLVAEDLVSVDPLRGMVVRDVDAVELEEIYVIRETLDSLAARLAAERVTATDLAKLRLLMDLMRDSAKAGHWEAMVQANIKFHDIIHHAAGNRRLRLLTRSLQDFVRRFSTTAFTSPERAGDVLDEHEQIVAALEARSPEAADIAARRHVTEARAYLSDLYLSQGSKH
jgi:DNA-binding GntR family transcriptional regulator